MELLAIKVDKQMSELANKIKQMFETDRAKTDDSIKGLNVKIKELTNMLQDINLKTLNCVNKDELRLAVCSKADIVDLQTVASENAGNINIVISLKNNNNDLV